MRKTFYGFKLSEISDVQTLRTLFTELNNQWIGLLFGFSPDIARNIRQKLGVEPHQRNGFWGEYRARQAACYKTWVDTLTTMRVTERSTELKRTKWHMLVHPSVSLALRTPPAEVPSWQATAAVAELHVEEERC